MSLEKEISCSDVINSIGLVLDVLGFIGLFFHKTRRIKLTDISYLSRVRFGNQTLEQTTKDIFESLERSFKELYDKNKALDRRSWPYFLLIIIGFLFQLFSQFL